jgi:GGDEF domain-containing protein
VVVGRGGDGEPIALAGSIGIAVFGPDTEGSWSPDGVLAEADAAMYAAKHRVRAAV